MRYNITNANVVIDDMYVCRIIHGNNGGHVMVSINLPTHMLRLCCHLGFHYLFTGTQDDY